MDFTAFDTRKMDEYAKQAKASWGQTPEYREFEKKSKNRSKEDEQKISVKLMGIFAEFGKMKQLKPSDDVVQKQVKKLQDYITEHFYTCSNEILSSLGGMYAGGGSMTENINNSSGDGTAEFVAQAIEVYCNK